MEILNKVKNSGLVTIDLEDFLPDPDTLEGIDIKERLWNGIVLKEKDFRNYISTEDWTKYQGKTVYIFCSEDAIIPPWAYMLIASALHGIAVSVYFGNISEATEKIVIERIENISEMEYLDARVVIKGCAKITNIEEAFTKLTSKLRAAEVKSIMYGEPCSTVPIYKAQKK